MSENEALLKRLQEQNSHYNVYDWEHERKQTVRMVKNICYYPPSLLKKKGVKKSTRRTAGYESAKNEPNRQLFELYQKSLRENTGDHVTALSAMPENDLERVKSGEVEKGMGSVNASTEGGTNLLPEVSQPGSSKNGTKGPAYHTATASSQEITGQRFGVPGKERLATSNVKGSRMKSNQLLPIQGASGSSQSMDRPNPERASAKRAKSTAKSGAGFNESLKEQSLADGGPNKINIIAKKRPPPMNVGYNENGIDMKRQVLYRNFHQIDEIVYLVEISRNPKKVFIILFPNFERPDDNIQEVLTDKQATKLMAECGNMFDNFIGNFYVKFGKLQIKGFHGKTGLPFTPTRSTSPLKQRNLSTVHGLPPAGPTDRQLA